MALFRSPISSTGASANLLSLYICARLKKGRKSCSFMADNFSGIPIYLCHCHVAFATSRPEAARRVPKIRAAVRPVVMTLCLYLVFTSLFVALSFRSKSIRVQDVSHMKPPIVTTEKIVLKNRIDAISCSAF
jgi:hypothetical protein